MPNATFATGDPQDIPAVLANRDHRAALQHQLVTTYPDDAVLALKLNIPGPIKNNARLTATFNAGLKAFYQVLHEHDLSAQLVEQWDYPTGPEAFLRSDVTATTLKAVAVTFEDTHPLGRLFDIDVLTSQQTGPLSRKDTGLPVRRCFICDQPAKVCARSRTHSVAELQAAIDHTITTYFNEQETP